MALAGRDLPGPPLDGNVAVTEKEGKPYMAFIVFKESESAMKAIEDFNEKVKRKTNNLRVLQI